MMKKTLTPKSESPKKPSDLKQKTEKFCGTIEYVVVRLGLLLLFFYEIISLIDGKVHFLGN